MFNLRFLIVEDDINQLNIWNEKIDLHNAQAAAHGFFIEQTQVKSLSEASTALVQKDFDAAVIDLRLEIEHGKGPNDHGNDVLKSVLENELAVVAVFSAETNLAQIPIHNRTSIKLFRKGEENVTLNIMNWLKDQSGIIESIKNAQKEIKREMAILFNKSIWPRWNHWQKSENQSDLKPSFITKALTRHLTGYIYASLLDKSGQGLHPEEWYFVPPIRDGLRTGDIVLNNGAYEVVITPRCDIATGKYETYQLVSCKSIDSEWDNYHQSLRAAKEKNQTDTINKFQSKINNLIQHNNRSSKHFLPRTTLLDGTIVGPFFVEFDRLRTVPKNDDELTTLIKNRKASISPEFLPSLIERLGAFFSRFGTPNYSHYD